ncbi:MAG: hypothetical protein IE926_04430 [Micrococcales bacterium]|uniref:hypothetical protein n=1 Tax=Phycicoccus sp. TaxID=1902410 RepID=UPI0019CBDED2|nr:hypothetical protein [Phycicoccus sp.]MBD3782192.1 hypothetical protein [Micrococcales bacterium]HMM93965.1 hypothetical protein [Phycicoccus sp.]
MRPTRLAARLHVSCFHLADRAGRRAERGDVPGWVLITLMTAGLVTVLWAVAKEQLVTLFKNALASVTG